MELGRLVGKPIKPTGYRWVESIKEAHEVQGTGFLCSNPFSVTELDNRVFIIDRSELVSFDPESAVGKLGLNYYKIPEQCLFFMKGRKSA